MHPFAWTIVFVVGGPAAWFLIRDVVRRSHGRARLLDDAVRDEPRAEPIEVWEQGPVSRWLALAGYRSPQAVPWFIGLTAASTGTGAALIVAVRSSGLVERGLEGLSRIPGAAGEIFWVPMILGPWILLLGSACLPWLVVRESRRRIVTAVERDLPLVLELLATLGEAGLGFDAALYGCSTRSLRTGR